MKKRNKACALFLILALCAPLLPVSALAAEEDESAADYSVIEISSPQEWLAFAESCTLDAWSRDKEVVLTDDISLSGWDYEPIPSFGGRFLGGGHTVSGLQIRSAAAPSGLFGETQEGAEIRDLTVRGTVSPAGDGSTVGGIVGRNRGLISNCAFEGQVTGKSRTGGLVGLNTASGIVDNSRMEGTVSGKSMTGGIAGRNDGLIRGCRSDGSINVESSDPGLNAEELTLSSLLTAREDASLTVVNVATDTGGICGYSAGQVTASLNRGAVGYPHIGYNVGGIVGRNVGYLDDCQNSGSVCGRRDIGGIAGQMEPFVELVLSEDMAQKLQQQMGGLSYLLNETAEDARDIASDTAARLDQIAQDFRPVADAALNSGSPEDIALQLGALVGSMASVSDRLSAVSSDVRQSGDTLVGDMQRVIRQLNAVNATLSEAIDAAGSVGSTDVLSDSSQENVDAVTTGKAIRCRNSGSVAGDINVGGVAGSMSIEVETDPEGDSAGEISSLLHREYQMKSILQSCVNRGSVTARKNCAGSVCGNMELGLIFGCWGCGSVESESGDYVGGIVGLTQGVVRACWAKCSLRGGSFVGGIAGSGARSVTTGAASMIAECRAMAEIARCSQYAGAVAGGEDGDFADNLFVKGEAAGINRVDRVGQAEPVTYEEMLSQEGVPSFFRTLTLEFRLDGEHLSSRQFHYGDSFGSEVYPQLPAREGSYAAWDVKELTDLRFDTVVNALYLPAVTALQSSSQRPGRQSVFFVLGSFREEDTLTAVPRTTEPLESITGREENVLLSGLRGDISRSRAVSEQWSLRFSPDGAESHVIRYLPLDGGVRNTEIYLRSGEGWQRLPCGSFGSYLTFTVEGTEAEIAAVETQDAWWAAAVYALAALLALLLLGRLGRRIKRRRKAAA